MAQCVIGLSCGKFVIGTLNALMASPCFAIDTSVDYIMRPVVCPDRVRGVVYSFFAVPTCYKGYL